MKNVCFRCGYGWSARTKKPLRCPRCKSTRWDKKVINDTCMRCGAEWIQRGNEIPKYCPTCHSSMWNDEKKVYTCPKCGKTRMLRSNSRFDLCPVCDRYQDSHEKKPLEPSAANNSGISKVYHLWTDNKGLTLTCNGNDSGNASLYKDGKLIGRMNIESWFRRHGSNFDLEPKRVDQKSDEIYRKAVDKILQTNLDREKHVPDIATMHDIDDMGSEILSLCEEGMPPIQISMKLGVPFDKVMRSLSAIPSMNGNHLRSETANARTEKSRRPSEPSSIKV